MKYIKSDNNEALSVEVRIPTFRRNDILPFAIESLIQQTWKTWRAIIFDDANDSATLKIVGDFGDSRISYRANTTRLGAAGNLNQCFRTKGYRTESAFACCLEDDNWMYPEALESNINILECNGASIMMRNQDIFKRSQGKLAQTKKTTLGDWFFESGFYEPIDLVARSFFYTGISNGALFWRTNALSCLQDPSDVIDPSLQEYIRCWQIKEPIYVQLDTALAYSDPDQPTERHYTKDKSFSRAIQHAHRNLLKKHGSPLISSTVDLAKKYGKVEAAAKGISNLASLDACRCLLKEGLSPSYSHAIRGILKKIMIKSPIKLLR